MLQEVNKKEFEAAEKKDLYLVVFHAQWCPPCRMFKSSLEELNKKDGIQVFRIDVDDNKEFAKEMGVTNLPAWFVFKNNQQVALEKGYLPYTELKEKIASY